MEPEAKGDGLQLAPSLRTVRLYFGIQTMWYRMRYLECLPDFISTMHIFYHVYQECTTGFIPGMNSGDEAGGFCKTVLQEGRSRHAI